MRVGNWDCVFHIKAINGVPVFRGGIIHHQDRSATKWYSW